MSNKLVKDYAGNLISKSKARYINDKYYEENVSCFLIRGQWYRINSPKIVYDSYKAKYVLREDPNLISGIINEKGEMGFYSANPFSVTVKDEEKGRLVDCISEKIAELMGYKERLQDGLFYKKESKPTGFFIAKSIPQNERSSEYNLESSQEKKNELIKSYNTIDIPISAKARRISKYIGDFSFGFECEIINGFIPKRIRNYYGIKVLKDGSLRYDGGEGLEYTSVPMSGPKGIQVMMNVFDEINKRCEVNNLCSFHLHLGNTRRDKLYVISLYKLIEKIQKELITYFPFSRFNSIRPDGKTYCNPLLDLGINTQCILNSEDELEFKRNVVKEFSKIYSWLNEGHDLAEEFAPPKIKREITMIGGRKMFRDVWLKNIYTTRQTNHAVNGQKWDKHSRYFIVNFLNLFFSNIGTIEFRPAESCVNGEKALVWLIVYSSILKYADNIEICLTKPEISLKEVLEFNTNKEVTASIMDYMNYRKNFFFDAKGTYKDWKSTEIKWFKLDQEFDKHYKLKI